MKRMQTITDGIWTLEFPLRMAGMHLGRRVTVLELAPGKVAIHSTAPFAPEDAAAIRALGEVVALVEATVLHDTFSREGRAAFPEVPYFVPNGFPKRCQGPMTRPLEEAVEVLGETLEVARLEGMRFIEEWVCYHPASRTLIIGDALLNLRRATGWTRWAMRYLAGVRAWPAIDRPFRLAIRDRRAFTASLRRIAAWDFERILVAHGEPILTEAKSAFLGAAHRAGFGDVA